MEPREIDVNVLVTDLYKMLRRLVREDVEIVLSLHPSTGRVKADPGQIEQMITNMVVNARDAMSRGGTLTIETGNISVNEENARQYVDFVAGDYVMLAIQDTGVGMNAEVKAHMFEPFFTTKPVGEGTGLGLATCFGIVKQTGGYITVESEVWQGAAFRIFLPRLQGVAADANGKDGVRALLRGQETVLLVEDEDAVRKTVEMMLKELGYTVLTAHDGETALRLMEQQPGAVQLLITDMVMPKMNGRQLADLLLARYPKMKVLFISGYTSDGIVRDGMLATGVTLLRKPFVSFDLSRKVREVLDGRA